MLTRDRMRCTLGFQRFGGRLVTIFCGMNGGDRSFEMIAASLLSLRRVPIVNLRPSAVGAGVCAVTAGIAVPACVFANWAESRVSPVRVAPGEIFASVAPPAR